MNPKSIRITILLIFLLFFTFLLSITTKENVAELDYEGQKYKILLENKHGYLVVPCHSDLIKSEVFFIWRN